jgi:FlaA1/EpsC-like NDP-sugar epimerase
VTDLLELIGRDHELFSVDIVNYEGQISKIISSSSFLVLGGAGSIGQSVVKAIFERNPLKLHVVDISENNMVELVRDVRSSFGYIDGDFRTFALDIGSLEYDAFIKNDGKYDYVLNLSALKHVRSEKDEYTLMRMIDVNIFNTEKTIKQSINNNTKKYFCVSTDKASNPVNMMGASKRIMEIFLMRRSLEIEISTARFANVAFSDGSLLHGFNQRLEKLQPIVAPNDIKRYFITPKESAELCLMSCIFGDNRDILFPKLNEDLHLISFADIAVNYLKKKGFEPFICSDEDEARRLIKTLPSKGKWPCLFSSSDTSGEKFSEEFYSHQDDIDLNRFDSFGVIKNKATFNDNLLTSFENDIEAMKINLNWSKKNLVEHFKKLLPNFSHQETNKYLDNKM